MRHLWQLVSVVCYVAMVLLVVFPVLVLSPTHALPLKKLMEFYQHESTPIIISVLVGCQLLLLFTPVGRAGDTRRPRRGLGLVVTLSALFAMILMLGLFLSIAMGVMGDGFLEMLDDSDRFAVAFLVTLGVSCLSLWIFWGWVFGWLVRPLEGEATRRTLLSWLLRGSILELLIAVPSHIYVRSREECCAPYGTALAMSVGLVVMFATFGPGVIFLYYDRIKRKRGRRSDEMDADVGGQLPAG